jgi:transforming growth factor-beta-induced protein
MVDGMKDITVFAPTNEAFANLKAFADKNNVELTDAVLSAVLSIHLGQGVFFSTDIIAAGSAEVITALQGLGITASIVEGGVRITAPANFATVVTADVLVANGVVHVIDTVLLPDLATLSATKETPSFGPLESTSESCASSVFAAGLVAVCAVLVF